MKKTLIGPLLAVLALLLLAGMFIYFQVTISRMEKTLTETQTAIADNSGKTQAIVNFFNSNPNLNAKTK